MNKVKYAVVPAAGYNKRLSSFPLTTILPKPMLPILNKPILEYIIDLLVRNGVEQIYLVVNNKKEIIKEYFGNGRRFGAIIKYVEQKQLRGIADAIYLLKEVIAEPFYVILGDTYTTIRSLDPLKMMFLNYNALAVEGVITEENSEVLKRTCVVDINNDNKIVKLVEKPMNPLTNVRGTGLYLFSPQIFKFIESTQISGIRNEIEITDTLNNIAKLGKCYGVYLPEPDVNINTLDDLTLATKKLLCHNQQIRDGV